MPADDNRDMSEPKGRTTRAAARKRQADRDKRDPNWRSRHFRDDLTVTDEVLGAQETNLQGEEQE